jgi:RNA polymerase sigma-70 factor, ECF subfamily
MDRLRIRPGRGNRPADERYQGTWPGVDPLEPVGVTTMGTSRVETAGRANTNPASTARSGTARRLDPARLGDHVDRLYRAARAMASSREEAEDLVQETYARVLRKQRFLHREDDIGYLLRVLRNTYVSGRRTAARRPQRSGTDYELIWIEGPSAAQPEARLDCVALYEAIAALPVSFRDALIAVDVLGLSYQEASRALRVREATITTRLHRARQRVAVMLAHEFGVRRGRLDAAVGTTA